MNECDLFVSRDIVIAIIEVRDINSTMDSWQNNSAMIIVIQIKIDSCLMTNSFWSIR